MLFSISLAQSYFAQLKNSPLFPLNRQRELRILIVPSLNISIYLKNCFLISPHSEVLRSDWFNRIQLVLKCSQKSNEGIFAFKICYVEVKCVVLLNDSFFSISLSYVNHSGCVRLIQVLIREDFLVKARVTVLLLLVQIVQILKDIFQYNCITFMLYN